MNVFEQGMEHLHRVRDLAEASQVKWDKVEVPNPGAMRSFQGKVLGYVVMVTQANTKECGIVHMGAVVAPGGFVIKLPDDMAGHLYHLAAASQN